MTTTVFRQSYMTQRPSLFTLINYSAIVSTWSNVRYWWVYCMRWILWCFCLLAESYETINHYDYQYKESDLPVYNRLPSSVTTKNIYFFVHNFINIMLSNAQLIVHSSYRRNDYNKQGF